MMEPTECIMQALQTAGPIGYPMMQNNHQSHQVPTTSAYNMMQTMTSDPYHIVNQVPLGIPMEQHMQPIQMNPNARSTNELLQKLSAIPYQQDITKSEAQEQKNALSNHRLFPVLRSILCDMKKKYHEIRVQQEPPMEEEPDNKPNEQLMRLDNMLIAEGVAEPNPHSEGATNAAIAHLDGPLHGIEQPDYGVKLNGIKTTYQKDLATYEMHSNGFKDNVRMLLAEQCVIRPITIEEADKIVEQIERKFINVQIQLKQQTCESVMTLRSRFLDARRKRRNFSKQASDILNAYFYTHLHNPYPSELAKEQLARQCDITVSQVSNWFGNKRIRYKKNAGKAEEEANLYANKKLAITMPYEPPSMPPPSPMAAPPVLTYNDMPVNIHQQYGQLPHLCSNPPVMGYENLYNNHQPGL